MAWLLATSASVCPSGTARATNSVPIAPVAPALFSMMTDLLHTSVIFCPLSRATRSMAPPGEAGTTIVMDLLGNSGAPCASVAGQ
jgi:hypothetical protein